MIEYDNNNTWRKAYFYFLLGQQSPHPKGRDPASPIFFLGGEAATYTQAV